MASYNYPPTGLLNLAPLPPPVGLMSPSSATTTTTTTTTTSPLPSPEQEALIATLREQLVTLEAERDAALAQLRGGADHPLCRASVKGIEIGDVLDAALAAQHAQLELAQTHVLVRQRDALTKAHEAMLAAVTLRSSEEESAAIRLIREATDRDHTRRKERAVLRFVSKIFGRGTRRIFAAWRTMWADAAQERANVRTAERAAEDLISAAVETERAEAKRARAEYTAEAAAARAECTAEATRVLAEYTAAAELMKQSALAEREAAHAARSIQVMRVTAAALTGGRWTDEATFKVLLKVMAGKPEADQVALIAHAAGPAAASRAVVAPSAAQQQQQQRRRGPPPLSAKANAAAAAAARQEEPLQAERRDAEEFDVHLDPTSSLGIKISRREDRLQVTQVNEGKQGERVGIKAGDGVLLMEGTDVRGVSSMEAVQQLKEIIVAARGEGKYQITLRLDRERQRYGQRFGEAPLDARTPPPSSRKRASLAAAESAKNAALNQAAKRSDPSGAEASAALASPSPSAGAGAAAAGASAGIAAADTAGRTAHKAVDEGDNDDELSFPPAPPVPVVKKAARRRSSLAIVHAAFTKPSAAPRGRSKK